MNSPLYFNYIEGVRVWDVVENIPEVAKKFPYCLITCIDSDRGESLCCSTTIVAMVENQLACIVPGGFLVRTGDLDMLDATYNLFNGYDELAFFQEYPEASPHELGVTSEVPITEQSEDYRLSITDWMLSGGCALWLGDGYGVNFITADGGLASLLERMTASS